MDEAKTEVAQGDVRPAHARRLRWGDAARVRELMDELETGRFDLVIGADLVYPEHVRRGAGRQRGVKRFLGRRSSSCSRIAVCSFS